jgi:peptidoglycan/LPS O-acetylase OafA/YrhL
MRPRIHALTTLRFFAALHVVLFHMRVIDILPGGSWWYQNFASIGFVGVNFFFVLSGFILVYTYGPNVNARNFWWARFARVYPAYLLSLIIAAPFFFFALRHLHLPFYAWSKLHPVWASTLTLTLLQAWVPQGALTWNSVCWSLSVEAFFYFVFPFFLLRSRIASPRALLLWLGALWLVSLFFSCGYVFLHPDGAVNVNSGATNLFWKNVLSFNPLVRLPEFLIGMMTGHLFLSQLAGKNESRKFATLLIMAGFAAFVGVVIFTKVIPNPVLSAGLLSPAFAAIIFGVAQRPPMTSFLDVRWLVLLGDASYSLYLLHSLLISRTFESLPMLPHIVRVAACFAAAIGASLLSYRLIEEPARRLLRPKKKLAVTTTRDQHPATAPL